MPHNWILKLKESNSKLHKLEVIKQALSSAKLGAKDADIFLTCAWYAYNPYNTYGTKKVPILEHLIDKENPYDEFFELLKSLVDRHVTGDAAANAILEMAEKFDTEVWEELLRPTILKDLRVGATVNSFNKVCKGSKYDIPVFDVQLATDSLKHPKKLIGKKIVENKLDGIRVLALVEAVKKLSGYSRKVTLFTRSGKPINNFPNIVRQLECSKTLFKGSVYEDTLYKSYILDGEIVSENFQALMKQVQRKTDIDTSSAVYTIFDLIPLEEFYKGKWDVSQKDRTNKWLGQMRGAVNAEMPSLHILNGINVDLDSTEGHDQMRRFERDAIDDGYEGIVIKDVDAPYTCKRTFAWLKRKPTITVDLTVMAMEEGTGKNVGKLGALYCEGSDQDTFIQVNVGSGLSDKQREEFWNNSSDVIGSTVEILADAISLNQDGTYSLRFPRFVRFRDDKS